VCVVCGELLGGGARALTCARCWARVRPLREPQCERCGHPVSALELFERAVTEGRKDDMPAACGWCALLPPYVRAVRSACWVSGGTGGGLVHALKYGGWTRLAPELATRMTRLPWPADVVEERTAVVPVPLAPVRLRERGFNQSVLLAAEVAGAWDLEVWDVLQRTRATRTQTRLAPEARAKNVSGAFEARPATAAKLRGTHLVLVDDVVTTCATLNACAEALYAAGARLISYLTFARASAAADRS
jgi:ComF family protein